ncbi:MAG: hypothetical protein MJ177_02090 [Clostridia bacterium]|nr:hypothetical protein [Clostridia bacterium]
MRVELNGKWNMIRQRDGKQFPADIPGTDFGALIKCGEIKNPLISGDENEALATASDNYAFSRSFTVNGALLGKKLALLKCSCVDTLCEIYINGKKALSLNNAFVPLDADIKGFLRMGENTVSFVFSSAYIYIKEKYKAHPLLPNPNGVNGIPYIRKPGCHFGWDWGPCVPYCGILDDIYIDFTDSEITDIKIKQNTTPEKSVVSVTAKNAESIELYSPQGEKITGDNGVFTVEAPVLWDIREQNGKQKQPLYSVVLTGGDERIEKKIGLRSVALDTSKDAYGSNFCFVLNGERVFAKGANLIPFAALFEDYSRETVDYYLNLAVNCGFNMLRVWGGGSYADEYFLSRCDELGILVWQDFCFACQLYPFYEDDFAKNVLNEITLNVSRIALHPSAALFCGNNEAEQMFSYLPKKAKLVSSYIDFFYKRLPPVLAEITDIKYIPSSPVGEAPFKKTGSDSVGDTHMWHVWHGLKPLDYYAKRYTRFMSEFGLESLPGEKAISAFAGTGERSMASKPFMSHQKCSGGNEKMLYYLTEMFFFPVSFDSLPYLTGIVQAECVKNAAVHFRQNKGRCNGCLFWQYNDVWNCPSWSAVDFEGVPKALMYYAKRFFAPVTVTYKRENGRLRIFAHNDTLENKRLEVCVDYYGIDGVRLGGTTLNAELEKNTTREIGFAVYANEPVVRIAFGDDILTELLIPPYAAKLKKAKIEVEKADGGIYLTADTFAYNVFIDTDCTLSDNYFSLVKGEKRFVALGKLTDEIKITCANNIDFCGGRSERGKFRLKYRLKPANIANTIAYSFM